jgi:hypothetical protein
MKPHTLLLRVAKALGALEAQTHYPHSVRARSRAVCVVVAAGVVAQGFGPYARPALAAAVAASPSATLRPAQRAALDAYIHALGARRYADAFKLLTSGERRYFGTSENFGSAFVADRLTIGTFRVLRVEPAGSLGAVAVVSENVTFLDHGHQATASATARVAYGLINEGGSVRIKDPYKPWKAFIPAAASAEVEKLRATVRKVSFFTGRVELLITFVNAGEGQVTLLPYGRSVLRDDTGRIYHLIDTKLSGLTDRTLRLGLPLAASAEYTGALTFFTPDRFTPHSLSLSIAPNLRDGDDAPFEIPLPSIPVPL